MDTHDWNVRKDIGLRCLPGLAGVVCIVVAFRMTMPSSAMFVLLMVEGVVLFGLAAFLVWRYFKTPASPE
jgi:hypothetical protein